MISKMNIEVDLTKEMMGTTIEDAYINSEKDLIKIHIPLLMTKIPNSKPSINHINTNGRTIFVNANECKPSPSSTILEKNYLEIGQEYNSSFDIFLKKSIKGNILPKNTKVQVKFVNGNMSHPTFNTNSFI